MSLSEEHDGVRSTNCNFLSSEVFAKYNFCLKLLFQPFMTIGNLIINATSKQLQSRFEHELELRVAFSVSCLLSMIGAATGGGGKGGSLPPPPTSDRGPPEIDTDPRRFRGRKKWGG